METLINIQETAALITALLMVVMKFSDPDDFDIPSSIEKYLLWVVCGGFLFSITVLVAATLIRIWS